MTNLFREVYEKSLKDLVRFEEKRIRPSRVPAYGPRPNTSKVREPDEDKLIGKYSFARRREIDVVVVLRLGNNPNMMIKGKDQ